MQSASCITYLLIVISSALSNNTCAQIISARISDIALQRDGRCISDTGSVLTAFSYRLTVSVAPPSSIYRCYLLDGDNRAMGNSLDLSGPKENESRSQGMIASVKSIAPYRFVLINGSSSIGFGEEVNLNDVVYSSDFFDPHELDPDCPEIICKFLTQDRSYNFVIQSQSPPIFIKRNLTLNGFSLAYNTDFYAGNSVTLSPGYDSGPLGTISSYGIKSCSFQDATYECWDLNQNGQADISEDINNDGMIDNTDCN